jgi:gliding motility-associated-like protein
MRIVYTFCLMVFTILASHGQTALFYNTGAQMYVKPGGYMIVKSDSLHNQLGLIENAGDIVVEGNIYNDDQLTGSPSSPTGLYRIQGDWINNGTVTSYLDSVELYGGNQFITGSAITPFHHLILKGGSSVVKTQTIDATVDGILNLNDVELATQQNEMLVLNTNPNSITKANGALGYVSSLDIGKLSRATNSTSAYFYPVGIPSSLGSPFYYRPIEMKPTASTADIYGVRLARDPSADTYDVNSLDDTLCKVNPLFYHRMYHTQGNTSTNIKMFFDAANDGAWSDMAHWKNSNNWNYMGSPTGGSGLGFSTITIKNWNDFDPHPFALGSKKFLVDAGPDHEIYEGQSASLSPIIGTSNIGSILWTPGVTLDADNIRNPQASPLDNTLYFITVTDNLGCVAKDSTTVTVLTQQLYVPTGFSPNKDGANDVFRPLNKNLQKIVFQVFNRWGEKVFETDEIGEGWDGYYKGVLQPLGVFVWKAEYQFAGLPKTKYASGNVTLVR